MITERRYALKIPAKLTRVSSATAYLRALARANFYVAVSCFAANFFDSAVRLTICFDFSTFDILKFQRYLVLSDDYLLRH